jgi:2'-5' RNA ligase
MLFVVAWPIVSEADDSAMRHLRAQYHPTEADLIGPHFTLVFGVPLDRESALRGALAGIVLRPFWFMIERIARSDLYLYAEPSDGAAELRELYEALAPAQDAEPFQPHITLGLFRTAIEAERVARIVERQLLPMHGRVEELALLRRDGNRLDTLASARLAG